jgi:hypothetical protein
MTGLNVPWLPFALLNLKATVKPPAVSSFPLASFACMVTVMGVPEAADDAETFTVDFEVLTARPLTLIGTAESPTLE